MASLSSGATLAKAELSTTGHVTGRWPAGQATRAKGPHFISLCSSPPSSSSASSSLSPPSCSRPSSFSPCSKLTRTRRRLLRQQTWCTRAPRNSSLVERGGRKAGENEDQKGDNGDEEDDDDDEEYYRPPLPGDEPDFWEGPQWDALGFVVQYLWAIGIVVALVGAGIAARTYNYGATDFKQTKVFKEAMEAQRGSPPSEASPFEKSAPLDAPPPIEQDSSS